MFDLKSFLWYAVLIGITTAYLILMAGVRSAKRHNLTYHSRSKKGVKTGVKNRGQIFCC
ncbi:MAG: hypothetical protein HY202_07195 [Nitrospirae bacterium]|nr:hypothetical protein [Nitrospirota bacterium]MBI3605793.1 hypothetical protein [Nitrospirota bacterium]